MKKFKNKFIVTGEKYLLEAFQKEAEQIGWKQNIKSQNSTKSGNSLSFRGEHYSHSWGFNPGEYIRVELIKPIRSDGEDRKIYHLPLDYESALKAASETIE